jgi:glycosyltransferase involved in cell wall biosynthesis
MNLLFVHQFLGATGGAEVNIQITARELRRRGHTLSFLYANSTGRGEETFRINFDSCFALPETGPREYTRNLLGELRPDVVYLHKLQDLDVIETVVAGSSPVVKMVHDHELYCLRGYKYNPLTRRICTRAASMYCVFPCMAPLVRNRHGGFPIRWASYRQRQRELELTRQCDRLVAYSDYSRAELVRNGFEEDRIALHVPILSRKDDRAVSSFSDRNLIVFAGQIIRGKGVDLLLRALKKVTSPYECVILGDGSHRRYCEWLSARLGLNSRVRFAGYLPPDQMKAFYLDATAVAVTSVWPEPFGMVGPEAMRYGLPVVAFDSGAVREWLTNGENGFLVPWMDITRFANSLEALLQNKALAGQLGRNGLERVDREYGVARQVDALEQLFWQVRASKPLRNPGEDRGRHGLNTGRELNVKLEQSEDAEDAAAQEGSEHKEFSGRMEERVNV